MKLHVKNAGIDGRRGFDALAEAVAAEGVEVAFGLVGEANVEFVTRLVQRHGVRWIGVRHEAAAVAMADGYARVTGRVGVCSVTQSAGLAQTATGLMEARTAGSPVVLIAGDSARDATAGATSSIAPEPFALATGGSFHGVGAMETLAEQVRSAFQHARGRRGPTVLSVPTDIQHMHVADEWRPRPSTPMARGLPTPDPLALDRLAAMFAAASFPVILGGRGAIAADAHEALHALADRTGALLVTTLPANDWFADSPWSLGVAGNLDLTAAQVASEADLVVSFGASLNEYTLGHGQVFPRAEIVQVDADPMALGRPGAVALEIAADAAAAAREVVARLGPARATGARRPQVRERIAALVDAVRRGAPIADGAALSPESIARICDAELPADRAVVIDIGNFCGHPALHVHVQDPRCRVLPWSSGTAGIALPVAIGVAVAEPAGQTVLFQGDGGVMFHLSELETVARNGIPLLVVVFDDGAYSAETYVLDQAGIDAELALFPRVRLAGIARELGFRSWSVHTAGELRSAVREAAASDGPRLIQACMERRLYDDRLMGAAGGAPDDPQTS